MPVRLIATLLLLTLAVPAAPQATRFELADEGWIATEAPDPDSPEGELAEGRRLLAERRFDAAVAAMDQWIAAHPHHPLTPEALLTRGDAKTADGEYWAALYDYEDLIQNWPASEAYLVAVEREYRIAQAFIGGWRRKLLGLPILPTDGEGEELLIRVQERAPGSDVGERASIALADYYFASADMDLASEAYDLFLENYPDSPRREWAMLRLIQASLARFKGPAFDGTGLIEADERLAQYQREFPATAERIGAAALRIRIRESLARRDLQAGDWYRTRGDRVAAAFTYRRLVADYPGTGAANDALRRLEALGETVQ